MKKVFSVLAITGFVVLAQAQEAASEAVASEGFVYTLKQKFIEGGPEFMSLVLICLILGLAFAIERIIYLFQADINTDKFVGKIEEALNSGGISEAKEVARDSKGPVASIAYQALTRIEDGQTIDEVEKSVIAYGGVEMGRLEKNVSWVALFIAIAPMLGFMGTVIGMVLAFDDIKTSGSVQAQDMAANIQVALLTTLAGLIAAIFLQIFYNVITAKIDAIVNNMEDASISIVDLLVKFKK